VQLKWPDRVDKNYHEVNDQEAKACYDQSPSKTRPDLNIIDELAVGEQEDANDIDDKFVPDVLVIDSSIFPLVLRQGIGKHNQAATHDDKYRPDNDIIHEDNHNCVDCSSNKEHQRVYYCDIPDMVFVKSEVQSLWSSWWIASALKAYSELSFLAIQLIEVARVCIWFRKNLIICLRRLMLLVLNHHFRVVAS